MLFVIYLWPTPTGSGSARSGCASSFGARSGRGSSSAWSRAPIFFAIFCANIEIARRLSPRHRAFEGIDVVEYVNERTVQGLRRGGLIVSLVIAIFVGAGTSADWLCSSAL